MRQFIQQLMAEAEEWKAIKMVVLGHGRVGKTTLLHAINQIMTPSSIQVHIYSCIRQNVTRHPRCHIRQLRFYAWPSCN